MTCQAPAVPATAAFGTQSRGATGPTGPTTTAHAPYVLQPIPANPLAAHIPGRRMLSLTSGVPHACCCTPPKSTCLAAVDDSVRVWAEQAVKRLRGGRISVNGMDPGLTHVVVGSPRRTLKARVSPACLTPGHHMRAQSQCTNDPRF